MTSKYIGSYSDFEESTPDYFFFNYFPFGALSAFEGYPQSYKTTLILYFIALAASHQPMPDGKEYKEEFKAFYISPEGGDKGIINGKYQGMGGPDDTLFYFSKPAFSMTDPELWAGIMEKKTKLVVFDPYEGFLSCSHTNSQKVRKELEELVELTAKTGCAVILINHLNGRKTGDASLQSSGSKVAYRVCRNVVRSFRSESGSTVLLHHSKNNDGPCCCDNAFEIVNGVPSFIGPCDNDDLAEFDEIINRSRHVTRDRCVLAIENLAKQNAFLPATTVFKILHDEGYSDSTIKTAKKMLDYRSEPVGGKWYWVFNTSEWLEYKISKESH